MRAHCRYISARCGKRAARGPLASSIPAFFQTMFTYKAFDKLTACVIFPRKCRMMYLPRVITVGFFSCSVGLLLDDSFYNIATRFHECFYYLYNYYFNFLLKLFICFHKHIV